MEVTGVFMFFIFMHHLVIPECVIMTDYFIYGFLSNMGADKIPNIHMANNSVKGKRSED